MLWILLGTGVQWFEDSLKEVFLYNPPVGILLNDCASIVQSCCYFVCCQNFVLEHVCHNDGKVMVDSLVEYFFSCIPLKSPPPFFKLPNVYLRVKQPVFLSQGFIIVVDSGLTRIFLTVIWREEISFF